jgi:hypothetical protein
MTTFCRGAMEIYLEQPMTGFCFFILFVRSFRKTKQEKKITETESEI